MQPISLYQVQTVIRFNKLEAVHAINHMKDATNMALHILKVSRHID